jgi:hypothetical protein
MMAMRSNRRRLKVDADQDGQDHRAERRHPRQLAKAVGRCRHRRSQEQPRQDRQDRFAGSQPRSRLRRAGRGAVRQNGEVGLRNQRRGEGGHELGSIGLPTQYRFIPLINPTDYKCEINRIY